MVNLSFFVCAAIKREEGKGREKREEIFTFFASRQSCLGLTGVDW